MWYSSLLCTLAIELPHTTTGEFACKFVLCFSSGGWNKAKYKCFVLCIEEWNRTRTQKKRTERKNRILFCLSLYPRQDVQCRIWSSILLIDSVSKPYLYLISLDTGADPENWDRGGQDTLQFYPLDTFYFCVTKFYKNNTKCQRKTGGRGPLGPPPNLPVRYSTLKRVVWACFNYWTLKTVSGDIIGVTSIIWILFCPFDVHEERLNCTLECLLSSTHYFIKHFIWNKLRWQARFPGIGIKLITVINPFNLLLGILPKIAFWNQTSRFLVTVWPSIMRQNPKCHSALHFQELLFQMQNAHQLLKFRHMKKAKFWGNYWVYKWHCSLDFYFLLSLPSSFALIILLCCFSSFVRHLLGFLSAGEVFGKAFRILGLWGRQCIGGYKWNKLFMGIFRSTLHGFLLFSPASLT